MGHLKKCHRQLESWCYQDHSVPDEHYPSFSHLARGGVHLRSSPLCFDSRISPIHTTLVPTSWVYPQLPAPYSCRHFIRRPPTLTFFLVISSGSHGADDCKRYTVPYGAGVLADNAPSNPTGRSRSLWRFSPGLVIGPSLDCDSPSRRNPATHTPNNPRTFYTNFLRERSHFVNGFPGVAIRAVGRALCVTPGHLEAPTGHTGLLSASTYYLFVPSRRTSVPCPRRLSVGKAALG